MQLRKSWINIPLLKNSIKRNSQMAKISLLLCLGFTLLSFVANGAIAIVIGIIGVSAIVLTTCYAAIIQSYLSSKMESAYVRSLPISTKQLWLTEYLVGYLLITVTLTIEAIMLLLAVSFTVSMSEISYLPRMIIAIWVLAFIYYSISYFVVSICGKRIGQFLFTLAFYIVPAFLYFGVLLTGDALTLGDKMIVMDSHHAIQVFLPIVSGLEFIQDYNSYGMIAGYAGNWAYFWVHIAMGLMAFVGSYFTYKNRPLERSNEGIVYPKINLIIRMFVVLVATLVVFGTLTVSEELKITYTGTNYWIMIALFISIGLVIAFILELLFKNPHLYKTLLVYAPFLALSVFASVWVGQNAYQDIKSEILSSPFTVVTFISNDYHYYGSTPMQIASKEIAPLLEYLEENEDLLYQITEERATISINFTGHDVTNDRPNSLSYTMEMETFASYLEQNPHLYDRLVSYMKLEQSRINFQEQEQLLILDSRTGLLAAVLDKEAITALETLVTKEPETLEEVLFMEYSNYNILDKGNRYPFINVDDAQIKEVIHQEKYVQEANTINTVVSETPTLFIGGKFNPAQYANITLEGNVFKEDFWNRYDTYDCSLYGDVKLEGTTLKVPTEIYAYSDETSETCHITVTFERINDAYQIVKMEDGGYE